MTKPAKLLAGKDGKGFEGLNPKQERFVSEYMIDMNATQAAIRAGYSTKAAQGQSARLMANDAVRRSIAFFQAKAADRNHVSVDSVVAELNECIKLAMTLEKPQLAAAVAAITTKAKICGVMVERSETKTELTIPMTNIPKVDREEWLRLHVLESESRATK